MRNLTIKAPAKINIGLLVKEKREDSYHNIESIIVPIKLYDIITIKQTKREGVDFICNTNKVPSDDSNLAVKAAKLYLAQIKLKSGVIIKLVKHIPVGAGLGGGSSDAASTLIALNKMFDNRLSFEALKQLAAKIGMDVSFFLYQRPCWAVGRGEILTPVKIPQLKVAIFVPNYSVSTKWAYKNINAGLTDSNFSLKLLKQRLIKKQWQGINALVVNTFEKVVFKKHPELLSIKHWFLSKKAILASLSGSGSAVFGIFDSENIRKIKREKSFDKNLIITETLV